MTLDAVSEAYITKLIDAVPPIQPEARELVKHVVRVMYVREISMIVYGSWTDGEREPCGRCGTQLGSTTATARGRTGRTGRTGLR